MNKTNHFEAVSGQKYILFAPDERDLWGNNHCNNIENNINQYPNPISNIELPTLKKPLS